MKNGAVEVKKIIKKITDFTTSITFQKKLSPKICADCGNKIDEEYESYFTKCDHCLSKENE